MRALLLLTFIAAWGNPAQAWEPIKGIPQPPFGIETSHLMYAEEGFTYDYADDQAGPVPYRIGPAGPYTHYVDPSHPRSTDTNNPHGTALVPRRSVPPMRGLPAGTVIYVHSGRHGGPGPVTGSGTLAKPIFIRGNPDDPPVWTGVFDLTLDYVVLEHFKFDLETYARRTIRIGSTYPGPRTHLAIRHCEFYNGMPDPTSSYQIIRILHPWNSTDLVQNIVIYDNDFHNIGDSRSTPVKRDVVGVSVDINSRNVWIIDNSFHRLGGDAIQVASDSAGKTDVYSLPSHIYIGGNTASDLYENFLDLKTCEDVIASENIAFDFAEGEGKLSTGSSAFRYGSQDINKKDKRRHIWTLYNKVLNTGAADGTFLLYNGEKEIFSDEIYFIGNIAYNCHNAQGNAAAFGSWNTEKVYWINNIAYQCDRGGVFFGDRFGSTSEERLVLANNIFGEPRVGAANPHWITFGAIPASLDRAVLTGNIFYKGRQPAMIRWGSYTPDGRVKWNDYTFSQFSSMKPGSLPGSVRRSPRTVDTHNLEWLLEKEGQSFESASYPFYIERFFQRYGIRLDAGPDTASGAEQQ